MSDIDLERWNDAELDHSLAKVLGKERDADRLAGARGGQSLADRLGAAAQPADAASDDWLRRAALAGTKPIPAVTAKVLAADPSFLVRAEVASNSTVPIELLEQLARDSERVVVETACRTLEFLRDSGDRAAIRALMRDES